MKLITFLSLLAASSLALAERVGDFMLLDQYGQAQELYYYRDAPAIVC